jgi:DNA-binding response OmpR family regulator
MSRRQVQNVLVIDDDPSGTQLLMTLLELEGYQAFQLENWKDPVSDVERARPDLVIMDVYLRARTGFELLSELRAHPDSGVARTPVLMMSAEDHRPHCKQVGADAFLEKPFSISVLMDTIREIEEEVNKSLDEPV